VLNIQDFMCSRTKGLEVTAGLDFHISIANSTVRTKVNVQAFSCVRLLSCIPQIMHLKCYINASFGYLTTEASHYVYMRREHELPTTQCMHADNPKSGLARKRRVLKTYL
jgi:hypothetical protein